MLQWIGRLNQLVSCRSGCDVARYGDDRTVIYKRKGLAIVDHKSFSKQDTMTTAYECWAMANHDPSIPIYVDDRRGWAAELPIACAN